MAGETGSDDQIFKICNKIYDRKRVGSEIQGSNPNILYLNVTENRENQFDL